jgi:dihydropyrimidinase
MKKFDLVIKNGTVVTASDIYKGDIGIIDGIIRTIGGDISEFAEKVIDADGKYVFPGGIDPHTHLDMPFGGTYSSDNFITGTQAAACGGTTTIVDFAIQSKGSSLSETTRVWREKADNKACIDYGIHIAITDLNQDILNEIPKVIKEGYPSFKLFMTYDGLRVEDDALLDSLIMVSENGGLVGVHAENYFIIKSLTKKLLGQGKTEPKYHAQSRPDLCEAEAAGRAIKLAKLARTPLYIVHNTCEASVSEIATAREEGYPIIGETCPQYLLLSEENYE